MPNSWAWMISMNGIRRTFLISAVRVIALTLSAYSHAGSGVTVERIEESELNKLVNAASSKIVITFLAAWCGPCVKELPTLNTLYKKYRNHGLKLIGISIDLEGPGAIQPVVDKFQIVFPIYWYGDKAVQKFKLNIIPILYFINDGEIIEKLHGQRSEQELDKKIRIFLKQ
jgi:thiol-disulfide isomerase/thioredoxin